MGRVLAIDYGQKRVGLAVTDPERIIASALATVDARELLVFLRKYLAENTVDRIVIGMPVQTDGSPSASQQYIRPFMGRLAKEFPAIPIETADERYTSVLAHRALADCGISRNRTRQDKGIVDRVAAVIILQSWMENNH